MFYNPGGGQKILIIIYSPTPLQKIQGGVEEIAACPSIPPPLAPPTSKNLLKKRYL